MQSLGSCSLCLVITFLQSSVQTLSEPELTRTQRVTYPAEFSSASIAAPPELPPLTPPPACLIRKPFCPVGARTPTAVVHHRLLGPCNSLANKGLLIVCPAAPHYFSHLSTLSLNPVSLMRSEPLLGCAVLGTPSASRSILIDYPEISLYLSYSFYHG